MRILFHSHFIAAEKLGILLCAYFGIRSFCRQELLKEILATHFNLCITIQYITDVSLRK